MGKSTSGAIRCSICCQSISIIISIFALFLPLYIVVLNDKKLETNLQVKFTMRDYYCDFSNSNNSTQDTSNTYSYFQKSGEECRPILYSNLQHHNDSIGTDIKVCLSFLVIGILFSILTICLNMIMAYKYKTRSCNMKFFTFIVSLFPIVLFLISALSLIGITRSFNTEMKLNENNDKNNKIDYSICKENWCDSFFGSKDDEYISSVWEPTFSWYLILFCAIFSLLSCVVTQCVKRYKSGEKFQHHYNQNDHDHFDHLDHLDHSDNLEDQKEKTRYIRLIEL